MSSQQDVQNNNSTKSGRMLARLKRWIYSIRGRLTLLNLALLGALFILLALAQYFLLASFLNGDLETTLRAQAKPTIERFLASVDGRDGQLGRVGPRIAFDLLSKETIGVVLDENGTLLKPSSANLPAGRNPIPTPAASGSAATPLSAQAITPTPLSSSTTITDATGTTLYNDPATADKILNKLGNPPADLLQRAKNGEKELSYTTNLPGWGQAVIVLIPLRQNVAPPQPSNRYEAGDKVLGVAVLAGSDSANQRALANLLLINLVAFVLLVLIISVASPLVARGSLTPLRRMIKTTQEISRGDLSRRVQLNTGGDEVGQLSQSFNQMVEQLENLFQAQRQLVADASHELRTPLTAIKGSLEVLMLGGVANNPEAANHLLKTTHQETVRLSRLVNDLLTLNKLDQGDTILQLKPVKLAPLLREVKSNAEMLIQQSGKAINLTLEGLEYAEAEVLASPDHLKQVLYNLLDNAIKASATNTQITLAVKLPRQGESYYRLVVRDQGKGIAAEDLPRIFDRFYRGDLSRSRQKGGSGLGLAIAKAIMKAHGAKIEVQSTPDQGSAFTLYLKPAPSAISGGTDETAYPAKEPQVAKASKHL
jgi:signal transduction histidine kinase